MNPINPAKLLNSKWTAVHPQNKEKHFLVSDIDRDEEGVVISCTLEAVMTKSEYLLDWTELKNNAVWMQGWK
ncbi:TIGR02450 family Trp-rich protein [Marinomonas mediterranea]|jgi:tryptophan-rich conserved hypothetical protein|uniref:TIGR02450 family Trp-rich protein n=1 Tax=Marinomonas mediterranea (strain ATCC 700492 / JCM 21426 / NBRC 103028 / MMB-1) TaxID=717774 RepID=F2JUQ2_MARM1|nr:TIGR02450 family Trp-rich protein [Marinomonas mediterranea]ADZ90467.1 Conserved hypothetical protein CHP02450, tryptophan-rich [Marinomonas mediterranea MMB-1]WCN08522.1 TIGR02450 family Trp-rich protein [Marinomonas mediterranea]WCN12576.1 TIGR02450 family Trp-rich protein [Marinomonas mediterranea]WCN16647.1 TIGR02450 family Trp-rich protein [Marinomonas mediterranea MMB-1]